LQAGWPSGKPDADRETVARADERHQFASVLKPARRLLELAGAHRRIAAQSQDVHDAESPRFFQERADLFARGVDAGQVAHRRQPVNALEAIHQFQRLVARAAAGSIRHGTEVRMEFGQQRNRLLDERLLGFRGLGREELEGNDRLSGLPVLSVDVAYVLHGEYSTDDETARK
jgi:hypothetical protein